MNRRRIALSDTNQPESLKDRVARVLAEEVVPALEMNGAVLEVLDVTGGVVRLRLGTAGGCCPSSVMAIIMGIEQELRRRVPEVEYLEAVP
jgi:Fe-S cluster biogenesis protein NfuA